MEEVEEREKSKLRRYDIVAHIAMVGLERSCDISTQAAGSDDYAVKLLNNVTRYCFTVEFDNCSHLTREIHI